MNKKKFERELNKNWLSFTQAVKLAGCYDYEMVKWADVGFVTRLDINGVKLYYKPDVVKTKESIGTAKAKTRKETIEKLAVDKQK